jgi:hypothetical protein
MRQLLPVNKRVANKTSLHQSRIPEAKSERSLAAEIDLQSSKRERSIPKLGALVLTLPFLLLFSCFSVKPSSVKSGEKYFQSFLVENGTQYFIKPLVFSGQGGDVLIDFCFRDGQPTKEAAIVNLSIHQHQKISSIDSILIHNESRVVAATTLRLLFQEKSKNVFESRFSANIQPSDISSVFEGNNWKVQIYSQGTILEYLAPKKTIHTIAALEEDLFAALQ